MPERLRPGEIDERTEFQRLVKGRFKRRRAKIGDVAELPTARGLAYAQYTHEHPMFGSVLRVLEGFHEERPADFEAVARGPILLETLLAFKGLTYTGEIEVAGNVVVPEERRPFPLFRASGDVGSPTLGSTNWWLWDGKESWKIGTLSPGQEELPFKTYPSYALLITWIEEQRRNCDIDPPIE